VEALVALMELVRGEAVGEFQNSMFTNMLAAMLKSSAFSSVVRTPCRPPSFLFPSQSFQKFY
jgi:hypothetical protein